MRKRGTTMQKTGIITDTNSGMTQAEARECGVTLMPMPFTVNGKNYFSAWSAPRAVKTKAASANETYYKPDTLHG